MLLLSIHQGLGLPSPSPASGVEVPAPKHAAPCFWLIAPHLTRCCGAAGPDLVPSVCSWPLKPLVCCELQAHVLCAAGGGQMPALQQLAG